MRTVLVDNSILANGKFAKHITVPAPGFGNRLALVEALPRKPDEHKWLRAQIETLPTIAKAARPPGRLKLYTYFELEMEYWRGGYFPDTSFGNVFYDIPLVEAKRGIRRSAFFGLSGDQIASEADRVRFCIWLLSNGKNLLKSPSVLARLDEMQRDVLREFGRFRDICKSLAPNHYPDAMHLWTGELNNIEFFLTTDATLTRALQSNGKLNLKCRPIFPEEILKELAIKELEPLPYEYGKRYYLNGLPYE